MAPFFSGMMANFLKVDQNVKSLLANRETLASLRRGVQAISSNNVKFEFFFYLLSLKINTANKDFDGRFFLESL